MTFFETDDILKTLEAVYYPDVLGEDGKMKLVRRFWWFKIFDGFEHADVKWAIMEAAKTESHFPTIARILQILERKADELESLL